MLFSLRDASARSPATATAEGACREDAHADDNIFTADDGADAKTRALCRLTRRLAPRHASLRRASVAVHQLPRVLCCSRQRQPAHFASVSVPAFATLRATLSSSRRQRCSASDAVHAAMPAMPRKIADGAATMSLPAAMMLDTPLLPILKRRFN
jgi:hypothetical protein